MYYAGKKNQGFFKVAAATLAMALVFSCFFPVSAWAYRSRDGGGDVSKADYGEVAKSVGITIGTAVGMQVISGAVRSASSAATTQQFNQSATNLGQSLNNFSTSAGQAGFQGAATQADVLQTSLDGIKNITIEGSKVPDLARQGAALSEITAKSIDIGKSVGNFSAGGELLKTATQIQNAGGIAGSLSHSFSTAGKLFTDTSHWSQGLSSITKFSSVMPTVVGGYGTYVATRQAARAVALTGAYYEWKPSTTYIASSAVIGGVSGFLNPEIALGIDAAPGPMNAQFASSAVKTINPHGFWGMARGATVGSLSGLGSSLGTVAVDRSRINKGEAPGTLALITGNITGLSATLFGRTLTDPDTYHKISGGFFEKKRSSELAAKDPKIQEMQKQIQLKTEGLMSDEEIDQAVSGFRASKSEIAIVSRQEALREEVAALKQQMADYKNAAYGQDFAYRRIIGVGSDGKRDYNVLPDHFFDKFYAGYKPVPTGIPEVFAMEKTVDKVGWGNLLGRYARAAFIEPFSSQNLPILASQSLSIWATSSIKDEKKQYWTPLVQSMISGVTSPIFRNLSAVYGIDSGLLLGRLGVGSKNDIMLDRMRHDYAPRSMAENERMAKAAKDIHGISEQYRRKEIDFREYESALNKINTDLNGPDAPQLALLDPDRMINKTSEENKVYIKKQLSLVSLEGLSAQERKQQEEALSKAITDFLSKSVDRGSVIDMNFNLSGQLISKTLRFRMSGGSTNEALKAAGMGRNKLFLANSWRGAVSGAFEGSISGGVESAFDKNYPAGEGGIATQFFRPYAANMITAVIRGASWHYNWNEMSRQWDWYEKWDSARPEPYALRPGDQGYNRIDEELSRLSYEQSMLRHKRALYAAGAVEKELPQSKWEVQDIIMNKDGGIDEVIWGEKIVNVPMFTLFYPRDPIMGKPALSEAIAKSLEQANMDYFTTTFSFGRPLIRGNSPTEVFGTSPENISAYSYMAHLNNLGNLANKGLSEVLLYQARGANIGSTTQIGGTQTGAAAKNIMSSIVAIPGAAGLVNMQAERFVKVGTLAMESAPGEIDRELETARDEFQVASRATQELKNAIETHKSTIESKGIELSSDLQLERLEAEKSKSTLRMERARTRIYELESQGLTFAEAPRLPSTVQQAAFAGPGAHIEFDAWVPFPNPAYTPERQHGAPLNFLRKTRIESAPSVPAMEKAIVEPEPPKKITEPKADQPAPVVIGPVDVKQQISEFRGAVSAAAAGQIALTPEQALESNNVISFRLDGDLSFRPGGAPPQVTPIYGPMVGPKDALPVPYLMPEEDSGRISADGTRYYPNKDDEFGPALAIKPQSDGAYEFSIVPWYDVPVTVTPLQPVTAPGGAKSADKPPVIIPSTPAAVQPATPSKGTVQISVGVDGKPKVTEYTAPNVDK